MIIHVYVLCHNEEKIIPFFLNHYQKFADKIIVYDNESTDSSRELYAKAGCYVNVWNSGGKIHDGAYLEIKQNAYKQSRGIADWVMVVDNDEFIYHPDLIEILKFYDEIKVNFPKIEGFDMVSETFPVSGIPITDQVKLGVQMNHLSKRAVFKPHLDMQWSVGCHPDDRIKVAKTIESEKAEIKLLHYKLLSNQYVKDRYAYYRTRLSHFNLMNQLGNHYLQKDEELDRQWNDFYMPNRVQVI